MTSKPFKVVNCLSQGFAVAGPVVEGRDTGTQAGIDFEMVLWGLARDKAIEMADELNGDAPRAPLHRRD